MPEIAYESHRGRGIAVGVTALAVALVLILGLAFRNQLRDLLYQWGVLRINVAAVMNNAEHVREVSGDAAALKVLEPEVKRAGNKDDRARLIEALAVYNFELNNYDKALELFKERRGLTPNDKADAMVIAHVYVAKGQPKQAEPYFREALAELSKHPQIPNLAGEQAAIKTEMKQAGLTP